MPEERKRVLYSLLNNESKRQEGRWAFVFGLHLKLRPEAQSVWTHLWNIASSHWINFEWTDMPGSVLQHACSADTLLLCHTITAATLSRPRAQKLSMLKGLRVSSLSCTFKYCNYLFITQYCWPHPTDHHCFTLFLSVSPQIYTRYGKCYTFNSGLDGNPLLTTLKGGTGNGLEIMLDIQQDEYLPVWGDTGKALTHIYPSFRDVW